MKERNENVIVWVFFSIILFALKVKAVITLEFVLTIVFYTVLVGSMNSMARDLRKIQLWLLKKSNYEFFNFRAEQSDNETECPPDESNNSFE